MQPTKTHDQIQAMRDGGKILATIFDRLKKTVTAGMTGLEVNDWIGTEIKAAGATPAYKTYAPGFPGLICISLNDEVVHGIPSDYQFQKGDIVSFDLVIIYKGMCTDSAFTMVIDDEPTGARKVLINSTERSLYAGIDAIKGAGTRVGDISDAIETVLRKNNLGIVRDLVGHGVGQGMHVPPEVPNYGQRGSGAILNAGDTIAIEPMATLGGHKVYTDPDDGWTIFTNDGSLSAHFEHTVLITEDGAEILTQL